MEKSKPLLNRFTACYLAFLLCFLLALGCFLIPSVPARATSQDAQIVYDTATNLAFETFTDPGLTAEEMAVISAQAGLAYLYAAVSDMSTWTSGQGRIYSGYLYDGNFNLYFGSAVINDDASTMYGHISDSTNNSISVSYTLSDRTLLPYTRTISPHEGFGASGGYVNTISTTSSSVATYNYEGLISGDPFSGWFIIGSSPTLADSRFKRPNPNNVGMLFYSGGLNLDGQGYTVTGDFSTDFADLKTTLQEDYPDVDPEFFLPDPAVDIPTDTIDCSGCNCYHEIIVNVEPTIIVEPTINVYVTENINIDNDIELPSDWVQDYTMPTDPYEIETIPFPTQETLEDVMMPTIDIEEYEETYGNAIQFWFYVAQTFIEKLHLQLIVAFAFVLSVVGFILWRLGGGGKND